MSLEPRIEVLPGNVAGPICVLFPGCLHSGDLIAAAVYPTLSRFGRVMVINHPTTGFDIDIVARTIVDHLQCYDRAVFIGSSMGTAIAVDVLAELESRNSSLSVKLIAACGILSAKDINGNIGLLTHSWTRPLLWQPVFTMLNRIIPAETYVPHEVSPTESAVHLAWTSRIPASVKQAQLRYLVSVQPPEIARPNPAVYITACLRRRQDGSELDGVIFGPQAEATFRRAFPNTHSLYGRLVGHSSWVDHPQAWSKLMEEALDKLENN